MAATESKQQSKKLTPEILQRVRFSRVKKGGYDTQEVDLFLHQLVEAVSADPELFVPTTEGAIHNELHDPEGAAQRLLSAAQRTADSVVSDAHEQAKHLLNSAEAQADNIKRLVTEEARSMAEKSQQELKDTLSALEEEKNRLEQRCDYLEGQLHAGKDQLLATVEEMRRTIEDRDLSFGLTEEELIYPPESIALEAHSSMEEVPSENAESTPETDLEKVTDEEILAVSKLMDSPPELSLVHDREANEVWLKEASLEAEEGLAEIPTDEDWDQGPDTEAIQIIDGGDIISGDRFFEELTDSDPHSSSLGEVDESTDAAMDAFFRKE